MVSEKTYTKPTSTVAPYAWVILAVVYLASVVAPFNQFKVPTIMPILMDEFGITLIQAGLLMSIIAMTGLVLALPAGIILQRMGPKTAGLIALGVMAAGAGMGALSNNYIFLLVSRVVEGIGIGLIGVVAPATISMWFPPDRQGGPMGIWATWVPVAQVAVYNLAPWLTTTLNWNAVWWVGAGFAMIMMLFYGLLVRLPPASENPEQQTQQSDQVSLLQPLKNRNIWLLGLSFACFNLALVSISTYYPTFLNEVRNYPLGQAAFITSISTIVILVSAPAAGWFSDRIGSRRLVFSLPFLVIAVLLLFPFHVTGWQIPALMIAQGLLIGAIPTATFAAAPEVMKRPELAGIGLAVILVGQNLGQLVGPVIVGQMIDTIGWTLAGYAMIPVCLAGFFSGWMVKIR